MSDDFSTQGVLAKSIQGFRPRQVQQQMAQAVSQAIKKNKTLIVEAGTGTGKTFAYLVPTLRSKKKVIISTGSKALQDQLYNRDLPTVVKALNFSGKLALLKGRANYLCLHRLEQQLLSGGELSSETQMEIVTLRSWVSVTEDGDINDCHEVAENSSVWPLVTSNNDNCLGSDCPRYADCFVSKARKKAMDADIVVVNHHLFLADVVVKDRGFGELIPQSEVFIFDEAHQLPDIACQYFGRQLSSRQLLNLAKDMLMAYLTEARDMVQLQKSADLLSQRTLDLRLEMGESGFRGNLRQLLTNHLVNHSLQLIEDALDLCYEVLKIALKRSTLLDSVFERVTQYRTLLSLLKDTNQLGYSYWYECTTRHFILAATPLSVAEKFRLLVEDRKSSWIFTSATLSVNGQFSHFTERLGLEQTERLLLASPFDYKNQSLLCVPRYLPEPNQLGSSQQLAQMMAPIIEANRGRCFFLCTSHQVMRDLAEIFRQILTLPVLMQGETSKNQLLSQFIAKGDALLVATGSFWEGVDVRGDTLSCVIIDKLPFVAPEEPLLKARIEDCRLRGGDPFNEIQLPEAVISLKQGVGRLIRDSSDYGIIIICDQRLVMRPYGQIFLNSLPFSSRTRDLHLATQFLMNKSNQLKSSINNN